MEQKHTVEQAHNWEAYEEVRSQGRFNMFDPNARILSGLSKDEYSYCMKNYGTLKQQAEAK